MRVNQTSTVISTEFFNRIDPKADMFTHIRWDQYHGDALKRLALDVVEQLNQFRSFAKYGTA
jgi:hypothetical protein